jgi:hypothetical protein
MKIARYLRERNNDRRKGDRRKQNLLFEPDRRVADRRSGIDRRYHHIERIIANKEKRREKINNVIAKAPSLKNKKK